MVVPFLLFLLSFLLFPASLTSPESSGPLPDFSVTSEDSSRTTSAALSDVSLVLVPFFILLSSFLVFPAYVELSSLARTMRNKREVPEQIERLDFISMKSMNIDDGKQQFHAL